MTYKANKAEADMRSLSQRKESDAQSEIAVLRASIQVRRLGLC